MKQIRLMHAIFAGVFMLSSCNKEEVYQANPVNNSQNKYDQAEYPFYQYGTVKELEAYIDNFSKDIGVDIFGLSESEYLELLTIDVDAVVSCFEDKLTNDSEGEILVSLDELVNKINYYAEQEDYAAVLANYNAMIDMIYCNTNQEPDRPGSAAEQFNIRVENMQENIRTIEAEFSGLKKLDDQVQRECYALAIYYKETKKNTGKGLYQGRCLNIYYDAVQSAVLIYLGQSIACGFTGPIVGVVCMAQATAVLCLAIRSAKVSLKNCVD